MSVTFLPASIRNKAESYITRFDAFGPTVLQLKRLPDGTLQLLNALDEVVVCFKAGDKQTACDWCSVHGFKVDTESHWTMQNQTGSAAVKPKKKRYPSREEIKQYAVDMRVLGYTDMEDLL